MNSAESETGMKKFGLFAFVAVSFLLVSFVKDNAEKGLSVGDTAVMTDVTMKGIDGNDHTLNQLAGKNGLLVVFSCNTCPFVVGSESFAGWESQYNQLHKVASSHGIGMVLVNSNEGKRSGDDSMEAMTAHAKEKGYSMPYVVDANSALANAFGAKTTPHIYLFDKDMKLIYTGAIDNTVDGKRDSDKTYLLDAINAHAKGGKIKETSTPPRGCSIKRVS